MRIAIIGVGMVGNAVYEGSRGGCNQICLYDKFKPERSYEWDKAWQTDLCFVCVPTPTRGTHQDLSHVIDACKTLSGMSVDGYAGTVVIKSTVLPGTMRALQDKFPALRFVHNPEFLRERTAVSDYATQEVILLSGDPAHVRVVRTYAAKCLRLSHVHYSEKFEDTEWAKMIHNCILPVKLSFLNEVYDLIGEQRMFDEAVEMAKWFGNVGELHKVPGPDGRRGWGGSCFTKDTEAMVEFANQKEYEMHTLEGAINTNKKVRGDK